MHTLKRIITNQYFLFWTFLVMLILPNVFMAFTERTGWLTRVVAVILPLGVYWLAMTLARKPGKMFWCLFMFIFLAAFQIVLLYLFGESPIAVDMFLNVVTTNVTEANELLAQIFPSVVFVFLVYGGGIALSVVSLRSRDTLRQAFRHNQRVIGGTVTLLGIVLLAANYLVDRTFAMHNDVFPVNACYNAALSVKRFVQSERYPTTSAHFVHHAQATRPDSLPEVYVLIIGETLRADQMSLYGYDRPTSPRLQALADSARLVVYRDAITMSNTTHKSVPLLLTATAAEQCYDSLYTQRGLIGAFDEAGFQTYFVSNQRRNHSFIDYLGSEAASVCFLKDTLPLTANVPDERLLDKLDECLHHNNPADAGPTLVVLHCYGSHFDYRDRYPKAIEQFKPVDYPAATKRHRGKLVNAYDNTILAADRLIDGVVQRLDSLGVPAVMLFTSDHGEDIFDDDRARFLHASPQPTYYQLRVPMLLWASGNWRERHPNLWQAIVNNSHRPVSTNMVTFHTMLHMAGIKADLLRESHAVSSRNFAPARRLYVNDHNELLPLDSCGLRPQDAAQFRAHGLQFP